MWAGKRRTEGVIFREKNLDDMEEMEGVKESLEINVSEISEIQCISKQQDAYFIATLVRSRTIIPFARQGREAFNLK